MMLHGLMNVGPIVMTVFLLGAGIPLAMRKVPMNLFYGFRVPKTMSSPEIWYEANYNTGVNMITASGVTLLVWAGCFLIGGGALAAFVAVPVTVVTQAAGLIVSFVQLSKL